MWRKETTEKGRLPFGRRKKRRKAYRGKKRQSCRPELLATRGWSSRWVLLESQGSAPGDNHNHRRSEGGKDDQNARSAGEKIPKNWKSWLRRQKDDRENGWGRQNRQKDGMKLPLGGSEVGVHRKPRSSRVSCSEKGEFLSGVTVREWLGGMESGDHSEEMGIWGDH